MEEAEITEAVGKVRKISPLSFVRPKGSEAIAAR
jgi:hypothetical protein